MSDHRLFSELSQRLAALLPRAQELRDDTRTKIEQILQQGFSELNLVTEEEFQSQVKSLQRAQARIDEMEAQIATLEQRLAEAESGSQ